MQLAIIIKIRRILIVSVVLVFLIFNLTVLAEDEYEAQNKAIHIATHEIEHWKDIGILRKDIDLNNITVKHVNDCSTASDYDITSIIQSVSNKYQVTIGINEKNDKIIYFLILAKADTKTDAIIYSPNYCPQMKYYNNYLDIFPKEYSVLEIIEKLASYWEAESYSVDLTETTTVDDSTIDVSICQIPFPGLECLVKFYGMREVLLNLQFEYVLDHSCFFMSFNATRTIS